jgi:hypothetical protein
VSANYSEIKQDRSCFIGGRRNLWAAAPAPGGKGYFSHQITHYADDDGQGDQ